MIADLGIDGGGSGSRWLVTGADGAVLARGAGAPLQATRTPPEQVAETLDALLRAAGAVATPSAVVAGIAGAGAVAVRRAVLAAWRPGLPAAVVGDVEIAAGAALADGPGVAVWSGTGSFAVARDREGRLVRAGGRGPLLGDDGSGFAIVRRAARAVVRAFDGDDDRAEASALGVLLGEAFLAATPADLGRILQALPARAVAAHAGRVVAAAASGDPLALTVVEREAALLAATARAAARRAGLGVEAAVTVGGGLATHVAEWCAVLRRALCAAGFSEPIRQAPAAVEGAARLARALRTGEAPVAEWLRDERAA